MKKSQRVILTIWIVLITLAFVVSLAPFTVWIDNFPYASQTVKPVWKDFGFVSFIVSVPMFIIYKIWGK